MYDVSIREKKSTPRDAKGRPQIDTELCKGCELCIAACPEGVLKLADRTNSQGVPYAALDPEGVCSACLACAIVCPDSAIEIFRFVTEE